MVYWLNFSKGKNHPILIRRGDSRDNQFEYNNNFKLTLFLLYSVVLVYNFMYSYDFCE